MSSDDTTRVIRPKVEISNDDVTQTNFVPETRPSRQAPDNEEHTKIFRPRSTSSSAEDTSAIGYYKDPLVGWLVIVSGPGRGTAVELGYGVNSIGRDHGQRISLDFGDEEISRKSHAAIIYDQKSRRFFIQHGEGINLTYLNDEPVLKAVEIRGRETIAIGNTRLVFIPFCGAEFEWSNGS